MFHSTLSSKQRHKELSKRIRYYLSTRMDPTDAQLPPQKPKVKKPATESQKANMAKGWEALKARRDALAKAKEEGTEPPPPPPKKEKVAKPIVPMTKQRNPTHISIVHKELEELKTFVRDNMKPVDREVIKEVPVDRVVEKIVNRDVPVEKVVERVVEREKVLSGSALLDRLFFNK
jgi:hypothetical protein